MQDSILGPKYNVFWVCPAVKNQPIFTASPVLRRRAKRGKSQSPEDAPQLPECPEECQNAGRASGPCTRLKALLLWTLLTRTRTPRRLEQIPQKEPPED